MSSLHAVQRALEGRSGTTAAGSRADEKQEEQGEEASYALRTGPSRGPSFRLEPTCRGLLDRLGQGSNAYRAEKPLGGGESEVLVGFGFAEDKNHSDDHPIMGEPNFGVLLGVKWQFPVFDDKTTSSRRFEYPRKTYVCLNSLLSGD